MMDDLYRELILDHYRSPRNQGRLDGADITYEDDNPLCGDHIRLDLALDDENRVRDVAWEGEGCAISMASASMLSEAIKGKSLEELRHLGKDDMLEMLGIELGPVRIKCALLPLKVLKAGAYGLTGWTGDEGEQR
jgi:nitrogen fixation protein NifU and related proteins